jgi:tetratricopeptide (TPR) repeat protein/transcriptional regulator with XRE-family HTH domain
MGPVDEITTVADLARLLRWLRQRQAHQLGQPALTYRQLAGATGWSRAAIGNYLTGKSLPPTDRFDELVRLLGASAAELRPLATARDRVEEQREHPEAATVAPRQLPAEVAFFVGRASELDALHHLPTPGVTGDGDTPSSDSHSESREDGPAEGPVDGQVRIITITGMAGVGKTSLALRFAHRVADQFPDGQLYLNLHGFGPDRVVLDPTDGIRRLLSALGVPPARVPVDVEAQAALYRGQLSGQRMLILLDNARDAGQVRPLLPGTSACLVLVTSRDHLTSLVATEAARPLTLGPLDDVDARLLLAGRVGADRVAAEPGPVDEIIARCDRLPLALAIVTAHAATHPQLPLAAVAAELSDAYQRLAALAGDPHTDLKAVFSWSYRGLAPPAARLFRLLGLHPGPDLSTAAAASLAATGPDEVRVLLADLSRASLLTEHAPGRWAVHDLLRAYAGELARDIDTDEQQSGATRRILDHYLHTAHTADQLLDPTWDPISLAPTLPATSPERLTGTREAIGWFTAERQVLLAAIQQAAATGFDTHAWQLTQTLRSFLFRQGHWHDQAALARAAIAAAGRSGDAQAQIYAYHSLAGAHLHLGRPDEAHAALSHALTVSERSADLTARALIHRGLAYLADQRGEHARSLHHSCQALNLYRTIGHERGQADALNGIGWSHVELGDPRKALAECRQALTLHEKLGNPHGQANTWDTLGYAHHHLGEFGQAVDCYEYALTLYRDFSDRYAQAGTLTRLGDTHHAGGDPDRARDAWRRALTLYDELDHPDIGAIRTRIAGIRERER